MDKKTRFKLAVHSGTAFEIAVAKNGQHGPANRYLTVKQKARRAKRNRMARASRKANRK